MFNSAKVRGAVVRGLADSVDLVGICALIALYGGGIAWLLERLR